MGGKNSQSFDVIEDFVKRSIEFDQVRHISELSKADSIGILVGKIAAFKWLPFLDEERGSVLLRSVLADETAARAYLSLWQEEKIPSGYGNLDRASFELRAVAAEGLVLSDVNTNLELVEQQYRILNTIVASIPSVADAANTTEDEATQNGHDVMFLASLAGVLAKAGYIKDYGLESYLSGLGSIQLKDDLRLRLQKLLDSSSVFDN